MGTQAAGHQDPLKQLVDWYHAHRRRVLWSTAFVVAIAGGVWFIFSAQARKERFAQSALEDARSSVQAGNLPLAASDLKRIVDGFGGTHAADEAAVLLAKVRLQQDDPAQAATELRAVLTRGMNSEFRAPAYELLGTALEAAGNHTDAAQAFADAAAATTYRYLAAQYLTHAAQEYAVGGDTAQATSILGRVVSEYKDAPAAVEARVRLAELTAGKLQLEG